ncbi:hypothetical protein C2G38_2097517 [Gigaspora rosea]|uniref:Uncharacterized protein n=1 Tax=Gigaspora rosea TaxID=44941 RepID=A0A397UYF1_9GLOM|nr:hypothetical protein C2G38_2097517 [Gigaspora rosea]
MTPVNRGKLSEFYQEILNPRRDDEHVSMLVREKDNRQENSNLNQVTPNQQEIPRNSSPNSYNDQGNQNSRNIYNHSTFNNCIFNNYY